MLLFPVIAWYDIISVHTKGKKRKLLFPVIAWYDIIIQQEPYDWDKLLFPVIAWYDIISRVELENRQSCCSRLSLGMI